MLRQRPGLLPQGWSTHRIGEFATECKHRAGHQTDLPVLSVTKHHGIVRSDQFFNKRVHGKDTSRYKVVHPGQFAYATIHLNEGSIGKLRGSVPGIVSPMYTVFDVHGGIDPDYLFAVLKSRQSLSVYERITQGTVNRRGGISFRTLSEVVLHHAPLPEQRKIAAIVSSVDDAIEKTQAVIDQLQAVKRGLMQELLARGLPGRHTRFKRTETGNIPEEWNNAPLGNRVELQSGFPFKSHDFSTEGDRLLRGSNVGVGSLIWSDDRTKYFPAVRRPEVADYELRNGDIVIAMDRPFISDGFKIARVTDDDLPALLLQRVGRFRRYHNLRPEYLWQLLQSRYVKIHLQVAQKGTDLPHISKSEIESSVCPFPPVEEQAEVADCLGSLDSLATRLEQERRQITVLKTALVSVLLTGELRVVRGP